MTYNPKDGIWYVTSAEYGNGSGDAVAGLRASPSTKVYVYETGKVYVTDGSDWHELFKADQS